MCGIFGIQTVKERNITEVFADKISSLMNHRGPDATGFYGYNSETCESFLTKGIESHNVNLFLMHKRLSILDLTEAGDQPMQTADGRYAFIFNGEIYNYKKIREELEHQGVLFHTNCDTEVLLQYLVRGGIDNLQALEGMFAFALFDKQENRLFLARDPFGIKPLYYFKNQNCFVFSSQIDCLLEMPELGKRSLNINKYLPFLRHGTSDCDDQTLIEGIYRLEPGQSLTSEIRNDTVNVEIKTYFTWENNSSNREILSFGKAKQQLREKLENSIQMHLISDVPVCFNLSGGVDSSALVALASQFHKNVTAFTYQADDSEIDESHFAEDVANHCKIDLVKVKINPKDFGEDLDDIILKQGEPYAGSSIYAQRKLYEAQAKEGFKVCLDGQGGDELFAGYNNYFAYVLKDAFSSGDLKRVVSLFFNSQGVFLNIKRMKNLGYIVDGFLRHFPGFQIVFRWACGKDLCPFYLDRKFFKERFFTRKKSIRSIKVLRDALDDATLRTSIPTLVRYADRNAMTFSIENRVPFLCNSIAQFAHTLPNEFLISNTGWQKYILRKSVADILPTNVIWRKDKMGFVPTENIWLLHNKKLITKILNSETLETLPGIKSDVVREYWKNISDKNQLAGWRTDIVWRLVNMVRWVELNGISNQN